MSRTTKANEPEVFNRLAVLRAERGLSRKDLAEAVGIHYQTVGYLERGEYKPSLVIALQMANLFGLPVEEIFSLEPMPALSDVLVRSPKRDATA